MPFPFGWQATRVPQLRDLGLTPDMHVRKYRRLRGKQNMPTTFDTNWEGSWRKYIRGQVVSRHARQMIVHFMSMCMGRSADEGDTSGKGSQDMMVETQPMLNLSVAQVHQVISSMGQQSASGTQQTKDGQQ